MPSQPSTLTSAPSSTSRVLPLPARPTGAGTHPPVSSRHVHPVEAGPEHRDAAASCAPLPLHPVLEARPGGGGYAVSVECSAPPSPAPPCNSSTSARTAVDA